MKTRLLNQSKSALALVAAFALAAGMPLAAHAGDPVKQVKVKNHKVKVKVVGGKAKIKEKRNGKEKVKVKGRNGEYAVEIAEDAKYGTGGQTAPPPYYGK